MKTVVITSEKAAELPGKLDALKTAGFAYCFIDTPPTLTEPNRQVLKLADLLPIPTRPSPNDLWSLEATLRPGQGSRDAFCLRVNPSQGQARITIQTVAALSQHGQVVQSVVHDRVDYPASMTDGRTALEISPNGPDAAEIAELWGCPRKRLNEFAKIHELKKGYA